MRKGHGGWLRLLMVLAVVMVGTIVLAAPGSSWATVSLGRGAVAEPSSGVQRAPGSQGAEGTTDSLDQKAPAAPQPTEPGPQAAAEPAQAVVEQPLPESLLPPPATLQTGQQWVLPSLTSPGWVGLEPQSPNRPLVVGYYAEDWEGDTRALESLRQAGSNVDRVVNFQLLLQPDGTLTTRSYPALMAEARARGLPVYGLVHNLHDGQFSAGVARAVLGDPVVRQRAVEQMLAAARNYGLAGIDVDIENVPADLREGYTALVRELAERLKPEGYGLSLSVPAKVWDDRQSNWGGAFDYRTLGHLADRVAVMTYDEHSPGFPAGPVASLGWVDRVAAYASSQIEPRKVLLGIAAYGYDWVMGTPQARGLSATQAQILASRNGAQIEWDDAGQVPYFTYWENGRQRIVYFENAYSTGPKLELVRKYGLGGIAIWRLGLEDREIWPVIQAKLR